MAHLCTRNSSVFRGSTRGRGELLNLNSNLNSVEKGKRIGKINFEKKRIERIYIYIYVYVYSIDSRRIYRRSRWRSTEVRISISKLLNLPRFDDTGLCNYRFVERPSVTVYWQVARLYRGFIKISEGDVPPSLSYIRIKGSCGTNHY